MSNVTKYIDKNLTGKKNLEELIKDSVTAEKDFEVAYDPLSISINRRVGEENTSVDLTVVAGANSITTNTKYNRPDLSKLEKEEQVFFFEMEDIIKDDFESRLPSIVSNRLSIPIDNFTIENFMIHEGGHKVSFEVVSTQVSETIFSRIGCSGFIRLKRFVIDGADPTLGIYTPEYFHNRFPETLFEPNRTAEEIVKNYIYSKVKGSRQTFDESNRQEFYEASSSNPSGYEPLLTDNIPAARSDTRLIFFKTENKQDLVHSGTYTFKRQSLIDFAPRSQKERYSDAAGNAHLKEISSRIRASVQESTDLTKPSNPVYHGFEVIDNKYTSKMWGHYNTHTDIKLWTHTLDEENKDGNKTLSFLYYADPEFAQKDVTKVELQSMIYQIEKYVIEKMGLPKDTYYIPNPSEHIFRQGQEEEQEVSVLYLLVKNGIGIGSKLLIHEHQIADIKHKAPDGIEYTWAAYPIILVFAKENKCQLLTMKTYMEANNHTGFIEGVMDGFSIGDIEWWMIDAGYVRDPEGGRVTRTEDIRYDGLGGWGGGSYTYGNPPGCTIDSNGDVVIGNVTYSKDRISVYAADGSFRVSGTGYTCTPWTTINWAGRPGADGSTVPGSFSQTPDVAGSSGSTDIDKIKWPDKVGGYGFLDLSLIKNRKLGGFDLI